MRSHHENNNPVLSTCVVENPTTSDLEKYLPFAWRMEYEGLIHALVGTKHDAPRYYGKDIGAKLDGGIEQVLLELDLSKGLSTESASFREYVRSELSKRFSPEEISLFMPFIRAYTETGGVDFAIDESARTRGIRVDGLETQAEQIKCIKPIIDYGLRFIDSIPPIIRRFIVNKQMQEKALEMLAKQQEDYDIGNSLSFLKTSKNFCAFFPDIYEQLVVQRNKTLVERSLPYLTKPTLVAVGAGHFIAEPTMLTLYEQQGAKITRMEKKDRY